MIENILGILMGGFILWVLSRGDYLDKLFRKKLGDFTMNDVFAILFGAGAILLLIKSLFGLI